jgi:deoxyribonuclease-4
MDLDGIKIGIAGNPVNLSDSKFAKEEFGILPWTSELGLNAQERQMTYGARMREEKAVEFGKLAKKFDIALSVHGPYYVVLTSEKEGVGERSIKSLLKTCHLAELMGAQSVVFHPGFGTNIGLFMKRLREVEKDKPSKVILRPETMGKGSQFGSVEEVISICEKSECEPCIDFGHVYARSLGKIKTTEDFREILVKVEDRLGVKVLKDLHCHFAPIEFGPKGEKHHNAVTDKGVFPRFKDVAPLIKEFKMKPFLISESRNSQDLGALEMKEILSKI